MPEEQAGEGGLPGRVACAGRSRDREAGMQVLSLACCRRRRECRSVGPGQRRLECDAAELGNTRPPRGEWDEGRLGRSTDENRNTVLLCVTASCIYGMNSHDLFF